MNVLSRLSSVNKRIRIFKVDQMKLYLVNVLDGLTSHSSQICIGIYIFVCGLYLMQLARRWILVNRRNSCGEITCTQVQRGTTHDDYVC